MADTSTYSRRSLLAGAGLAGVATTLGVALAPPALASAGNVQHALDELLSPPGGLPTSIASAHTAGVSYHYRNVYDLRTPVSAAGYAGTSGIATTSDNDGVLLTTIEPPAGAQLVEVEWYLAATAAQTIVVAVTVPGSTASTSILQSTLAVPGAATLYAHKVTIDDSVNGPYPAGSVLLAGASTHADSSQGIGGLRFGFRNGALSPVLLPTPLRAYDSRSGGGPLSAGASRTVSLAGQLPAGALGAILNLTIVHTVTSGYLKVYAAGTSAPSTSAINWYASGQTLANQATVGVSAARAITVTAGGHATDFIVDVVGYLV